MSELFASGRVVDLVLLVLLLEASGLTLYHRRTGRGIALGDLAGTVLAGASLLLALRAALTGSAWPWIAGFLMLALVAHLFDVARRWRR